MKKIFFLSVILTGLTFLPASVLKAQGGVAVNITGSAPDSSALFDVSSINKGVLIPRMTTAQRDAIVNPAEALQIYNTDCKVYNYNAGTPANPNWVTINSSNTLIAGVSISANPVGAVCAGTAVTFTATPSNGINSPSYQWKVNGGNVGTNSTTYSNTNLNNGDIVTCVLTSSAPCVTGSPATSNAITMLVNTVPSITGTTPAGFCTGSAVTLSASANTGTINWYADSTGGSSLTSGASFTVSGLSATTTYYVDATASGCTTATRTPVTATFYPNAPAQPGAITGPTTVNRVDTATYSISALPNTAYYAWTVSLGTITSGQGTTSIKVSWYDSSGVGSVSVTANNSCGSSTAQTSIVDVGTQIFLYTGSSQIFTVPAGYTSISIAAYGSQGAGNNGGLGGLASGTLSVTPGSQLYVYVGGQNAWNGGGLGASSSYNGGDESDVRQGGTAYANWVIVAGGGGGGINGYNAGAGGGGNSCANGAGGGGGASEPSYAGTGDAGTCTNGGGAGYSTSGWSGGGGGGGLTSGGAGSTPGPYSGNNGGTGTQGLGGNYGSSNNCGGSGAGGGGGYYGGGGSSSGYCAAGCGGGGSSWAAAQVTNKAFTGGVQSGTGKVIINW